MLRYMLDSAFCIDVMRDKYPVLRERFRQERQYMAISSVVLYELRFGAENSDAPAKSLLKLEGFTTRLPVFDFDEDAASHSAHIRADLSKRGCIIGTYDLLIAGHARAMNLALITSNMSEFTRVDGLRSEDWLAKTKDKT